MSIALYRRYRPDAFVDMIGQDHVTQPLQAALRSGRINHAYLFSGPRGCGKTTSARILARCLNCVQGPTDAPCGTCPSCIDLGRDGAGALDVVEIDAASHNGVDDARDIRERAFFTPSRDRYKIFIFDEAHMVTVQGFNALLKIVEEPPEHVVFIFATTEPEKVIGTIRSRTHHYPFRLVPQSAMLDYLELMCANEHISADPGVLGLVVRSGGGSVRDTLSLLDQLIAGSDQKIKYEHAVTLLGYTHEGTLDSIIDALANDDASEMFLALDKMLQSGQDPRRFVEDLLERLRDLIVLNIVGIQQARAILHSFSEDEIEKLGKQAMRFSAQRLTKIADIVHDSLNQMVGSFSQISYVELMIARLFVFDSPTQEKPSLESQAQEIPKTQSAQRPMESATPPSKPQMPSVQRDPSLAGGQHTSEMTTRHLLDAWTEILNRVQRMRTSAWMIAYSAQVISLNGDVLTLSFPSENDAHRFRNEREEGVQDSMSEYLRKAIYDVLGIRVKFLVRKQASEQKHPNDMLANAKPVFQPDPVMTAGSSWRNVSQKQENPVPDEPVGSADPITLGDDFVQQGFEDEPAAVLDSTFQKPQTELQVEPQLEQSDTQESPPPQPLRDDSTRYGESVLIQTLGAQFVREEQLEDQNEEA